jgi:hypothetical protein
MNMKKYKYLIGGVVFLGLISAFVYLKDTGGIGYVYNPSSGGSQTPWTSDINGGGYSLTNVATTTLSKGISFATTSNRLISTAGDGLTLSQSGGTYGNTQLYLRSNGNDNGIRVRSLAIEQISIFMQHTGRSVELKMDSLYNFGSIPIGLIAGTASGPSLSFTADTNTGLYNPSADKIGIVSGGSVVMTIASSSVGTGVGIGTTSPSTKLDVFNSSATSSVYIYSGGTNLGGRLILEDFDGAGCTELSSLDGVLTAKEITCP